MRPRARETAWLLSAAIALAQPPPVRVGPLPGGGALLPTGWIERPAGKEVGLQAAPLAAVATPDGRFLFVVQTGGAIQAIDTREEKSVQSVTVPGSWSGMALLANGRTLYVSGGAEAAVYEFSVSASGQLERKRTFEAVPAAKRTARDFIGDLAVTPDGRLIFALDYFNSQVVVINPQSGRVIDRFPTGRRPARILFHPDGKSYFVTSGVSGTLEQYMTADGFRMASLRLGPQVAGMVWRGKPTVVEQSSDETPAAAFPYAARIFVAAANTNRVFSVGVTETKEMRLIESIPVALTSRQPLGSAPFDVALDADESRLYVACAGLNAVAVADVRTARSVLAGWMPSGYMPAGVRSLPGGRIAVLSRRSVHIARFDEKQTGTAFENSPWDDAILAGTLFPDRPKHLEAIRNVVYVVTGPGPAPRLPGLVTLDNFHALADGQTWATAAFPALPLPALAGDPPPMPPVGYLWTQALAAGLTVRNFGIPVSWDPALGPITSARYAAAAQDAERAKIFAEEWKQGPPARLTLVRLEDARNPALRTILEAAGKETAVFLSSGAIAHPAARADSSFFNTVSMLRTIEIILGLRPMTVFDASSPPMWSAFQAP